MTQNVRTQNLQDFTVQIRDDGNAIIGTGVAFTMDGKIITCRHVVEDAIGRKQIEGAEINVRFPLVRGGEKKDRKAVVEKFFQQNDEDIVLLQLTDGASPLAPEQLPKFGDARDSAGNPFKSFGYRRLSNYQGLPAKGEIIDYAAKPEDRNLLCDPLMLESQHIDSGMSGAAVLDVERNLVVGIIAETYESASRQKDRDTSFAVDNQVLTFSPFDFKLEAEPYPLKPAPEPKFDKIQAEAAVFIKEKYSWNSAPTVLPEWTGRDDLLVQITEDWNNPQKHVTGLVGFGGEGKSSLARKWVETLNVELSTLDGLFWWGFYENRSIDEFLESALNFMSGGRIDPRRVPSSSLRAQIIGAMLGAGRYLFVLDGLEVLQHQEGDQYGLLQSNDLRDLLTYFARPDNGSFCLITSRAPVLDLMDYTTYTHRDVERLSEADGVALLEKLGVKGSKEQMGKIVTDWDGHALTVSLLGGYLKEYYLGDIIHLADIPSPTTNEARYERVHRILRRYDEHLTNAEREFLKLFSVFRIPVNRSALKKVFVPALSLEQSDLQKLISRLAVYRLLRYDNSENSYTTHPLIRSYYFSAFMDEESDYRKNTHRSISNYYHSIAGKTIKFPTLEDLKFLIEAVHHSCQAGMYDEAHEIRRDKISQDMRFVLTRILGAWETDLFLMKDFFPNGNFQEDPKVASPSAKRFILNEIGMCYMSLGDLNEALAFLERYVKETVQAEDWQNASRGYINLTELNLLLGDLNESANATSQALFLAKKIADKSIERLALVYQGWILHQQGDFSSPIRIFEQAKKGVFYMNGIKGIYYADFMRRMHIADSGRRSIMANLEVCTKERRTKSVSQCYRILGNLDSDSGKLDSACDNYETAIKIARDISDRPILIEALLARGKFFAKVNVGAGRIPKLVEESPRPNNAHLGSGDLSPTIMDAFNDLNEALNYAVEGGYRLYEADIRVALGWAYLANGEKEKAKESAQRALQMSQEMGYHWGKVDAEEVLGTIVQNA